MKSIITVIVVLYSLSALSQKVDATTNYRSVFLSPTHGLFIESKPNLGDLGLPIIDSISLLESLSVQLDSTTRFSPSQEDTGKCTIAFLGCDENRDALTTFFDRYYEVYYSSGGDPHIAFEIAERHLQIQYPNNSLLPFLKCE